MTISSRITLKDDLVRKLLESLGGKLTAKTLRAVTRASMASMVASVTKGKLRGQYLRRDTGTLIRSITGSPKVDVADHPLRIRGTFGSNLDYAKKHELGFRGREAVPAHQRKAHQVKQHARNGSPVRAHVRRAHAVRAHTRKAEYRARYFLRDTVTEERPRVKSRLRRAIEIAIRTGKAPSVAELRSVR